MKEVQSPDSPGTGIRIRSAVCCHPMRLHGLIRNLATLDGMNLPQMPSGLRSGGDNAALKVSDCLGFPRQHAKDSNGGVLTSLSSFRHRRVAKEMSQALMECGSIGVCLST